MPEASIIRARRALPFGPSHVPSRQSLAFPMLNSWLRHQLCRVVPRAMKPARTLLYRSLLGWIVGQVMAEGSSTGFPLVLRGACSRHSNLCDFRCLSNLFAKSFPFGAVPHALKCSLGIATPNTVLATPSVQRGVLTNEALAYQQVKIRPWLDLIEIHKGIPQN